MDSSEAIYLFVESIKDGKKTHTLLPARSEIHRNLYFLIIASEAMVAVYGTHKDEDGFLYFVYSNDDVFG